MGPGATTRTARRRRLGEVLVEQGAISREQLEQALERQRAAARERRRVRLGLMITELGFATERQVANALAATLSLEMVDLGATPLQTDVARLLPRSVALRHLVVPIRRDDNGRVTVACADPMNVVAIDDVKLYAGITELNLVVASESQLRDIIARVWSLSEDSVDVATMLEDFDDAPDDDEPGNGFADAPTVRLVNSILADAVRARASDIHVEPQAAEVRIRYRVDGLLRDVMTAPRAAAAGIVSRIKVMSNLDIAERRVPQDGRTRLQVEGAVLDARVSTLPSIHGEKVVVRLLAQADSVPPITQIGMDDKQLESLLGTLVAPQGLVLLCGPTGSGKTSTLYSAISQIKTPDRNIVTLEDPVEIQVRGITQVQVHERSGMTFARGLRSVLRQDPDVVLVGEVRDPETAKLALEASMTGHLVLTTLHTNSAPAALTRLVDMGVEPFLIASSLSLVVAQRLVRRVCETCAAPYAPAARVLTLLGLDADDDLGAATPRRGVGCSHCAGTGYRGRAGIFEVLPVNAVMRAVLMTSPNEGAVAAAARAAGMQTLRASAMTKAHAGITTYEEVLRVTSIDSASGAHCTACGAAIAADMVVCPWCTTQIDRGRCQGCDRPLEVEWRICPWCRTTPPGGAVVRAAPAGGPPRLLLVEDDESVRAYVTTTLTGTIEVDAVPTASDGLERATEGGYDGALIDQLLPDLTGIEMIRLLRSEARTAALPVMLFTGASVDGLEAEARNAGADDYLGKPVDPLLLEERLLALVSRSARLSR